MSKKRKSNLKQTIKKLSKIILKIFLGFILLSILTVLLHKWLNPLTSSIMIQRKIEAIVLWNERQVIAYEWVSYDEISKQMALAVIAAEDQNFPFHFGLI
jgi:monofunctional biosynthetic peptidoglycan transglycosylase